jgi:rhodanese-related sulfurtransferase
MAISKTVAWLNEQLELGNERLLLMDCRPQELYESSHIESAINVAIPGIMLRRLQKGSLPVRALFTRGEDRDRFTRRCGTDTVVLYDESSSDWNENTGGESVLGLLLKKLKDEGCRAFYLEGTSRGAPRRGARRRTPSCKLQAGRSAGASEPTAAPGVVCLSPGCEPSCVRHPRAWPARNRPASGRTLGPFLFNPLCFLPEMFFPYFLSFGF